MKRGLKKLNNLKFGNDLVKSNLEDTEKKVEKLSEGIFQTLSKKVGHKKSKLTLGQKTADWLTKWAGSWGFIIGFIIFLIAWMYINTYFWLKYKTGSPFDPYPFILLNLVLSCIAAIQAPIILMSQNRESQKDRLKAEYDYQVNRKAEKEIREIKSQLERIENLLKKSK